MGTVKETHAHCNGCDKLTDKQDMLTNNGELFYCDEHCFHRFVDDWRTEMKKSQPQCNYCAKSFTGEPWNQLGSTIPYCSLECSQASRTGSDPINSPKHYLSHPSGISCITITEHMSFTLGNAMKYIWRADLKNGVEDLKKAVWYLEREIAKRETK